MYSVGKYVPGSWGIRQVEEKLHPIYKQHTNEKGFWTANPNETAAKARAEKESIGLKEYDESNPMGAIQELIIIIQTLHLI